jgi:hypothetical protein
MAVASAIDSHGGVAFDEQVKVIGADALINVRIAGRPPDLDSFSLSGDTQSKMQTQIVLREVASPGTNFSHLQHRTSADLHLRADSQTIAVPSGQAQRQPMVLVGTGIAENHRLAVDVFNDHINLAVIIEIPKSRTPAGFWK